MLYEKDGGDINEVLFDGQALHFLGEVHILSEQSYLAKIYKIVEEVEVPPTRRIQETNEN